MNREFTKYLLSLTDLGRLVWLHLYSESTPNGNAVVNYKEIASMHRVSVDVIKRVFVPGYAAKKKFITLGTQTESVLVINFKTRGRPYKIDENEKAPAKPAKKGKQIAPPQKEATKKGEKKSGPATNKLKPNRDGHEISVESRGVGTRSLAASSLISSNENDLMPVVAKPSFTFAEVLKRRIIWEYCQFWKSLQASQQAISGVPTDKIKTIDPLIRPSDISNLREIAVHLFDNGFKTVDLIINAFKVIFANWHYYREFVQTGTSTTMLLKNINEIILVNQTLKSQTTHGNGRKEKELKKKLNRIDSKDYSHLD